MSLRTCFFYYFIIIKPKKEGHSSFVCLSHVTLCLGCPSSCLSGSTSENTLSRVRCNSHSSSSQTPSPKMHSSPSFTFGCPPPRTHTQQNSTHTSGSGGNKTLGPARGKFTSQPSACAAAWRFVLLLPGCVSTLLLFSLNITYSAT